MTSRPAPQRDDGAMPTRVVEIVRWVNQRHGTGWSVVGRLSGGYQQGAYELGGASGSRAVLKWHTKHLPETQLRETADVIRAARARGWPTSEWLAYGVLPDGSYIVEEFIEGTMPERLDGSVLDGLLKANRIQADLQPRTDRDWSAYIHRIMFEGEGGLAGRMRERPETAAFFTSIEQAVAPMRDLQLPSSDLVHGDFVPLNVIVRNGVPYLIDAAHAGKGTRAYDLGMLLMETATGHDWADPSGNARRRLLDACLVIVGRPGLVLCVAARMTELLVFGLDHWPPADIPERVRKCAAFLDTIG